MNTFTGGAGDDTFTADNTGTDVTSTADILDGGEGTDSLDLFSDGGAAALPKISSIETINLYDQDDNITLTASSQSGVETLNVYRGDGALTYAIGATTDTVNLVDVVLASGGVVISAPATTTALTIGTSSVSTAGAAGVTDENIDVDGTKVASVTLNSTGTTEVDVLDIAAAASLTINAGAKTTIGGITTTSTTGAITITGSGATSIGVIDDGVDSIVATTNTGGVTLTSPADNKDGVYTLSAGNDNFTTDDDGFAASDKFAVDAGEGTGDILTVAAGADISTADEGGRYTNFEIIRTNDSVDMSKVAGITSLQIAGGTAKAYTNMTAEQAGAVTFLADNTTSTQFALKTATGKEDAITINLSSATATTNIDLVALDVDNFEHVTFNVLTGTNSTGDSALAFGANKADEVKSITINGSQDVTLDVAANTLDVVPVTISAANMTGTADFTLTTGVLVAGSSVTGSLGADAITVSTTTGTTYDGGAGKDNFTSAVASLVATGSNDNKIDGGADSDTLTISTAAATLTDNHFTFVSNMEKLVTSTGATSLTTGAGFNAAFADGFEMTTGTVIDGATFTYAGGLYGKDTKITLTSAGAGDTTGENLEITTGAGSDTISVTASSWVGVAGDTSAIVLSTQDGDDAVTIKGYNLAANTTTQAVQIDLGAGADTLKFDTVDNGAGATAFAMIAIGAGDSVSGTHDKITGFETGDGTNYASGLNFAGSAAVGTLGTSNNFGTILSHDITNGFAVFDDAGTYSTALKITDSNLADVLGYLDANTSTNDVVAFLFDSDADGTNDATLIYHNGTVDSLVELVGTTTATSLITTAATTDNAILVV